MLHGAAICHDLRIGCTLAAGSAAPTMLKGPPLTQFAKGSFRDPHQAIRRGCGDLALLDLQDLRPVLHRPAVGLAGGQEGQGQHQGRSSQAQPRVLEERNRPSAVSPVSRPLKCPKNLIKKVLPWHVLFFEVRLNEVCLSFRLSSTMIKTIKLKKKIPSTILNDPRPMKYHA